MSAELQQLLADRVRGVSTLYAIAIVGLLTFLFRLMRQATTLRVREGYTPIPGPPGLPIIGNTLEIPVTNPQVIFKKWAQQYGEIYQIQLGFQRWVFLNSGSAAKEVIDKNSALSSSRPPMPSADFVSGYMRILLMPYGERWRNLRSVIHTMFTPKASLTFKPSQEFEAKQMIYDMYQSRHDDTSFYQHVRRYTTSIILTSTYGFRVPIWDCEDVREIYGLMSEFSLASSPVYGLVDIFPVLLKLPGWMHWWEKPLAVMRERQKNIWLKYWNGMKAKIDQGVAPDCFGRQMVEAGYSKKGISEIQAAFVAGTMIEAGSETTSGTFNSVILYLMANPEVVKTAQKEIARVIGDSRSPTWDDEEDLPYIRAIVKEILRVRPVASVGSPHYTDGDIVYGNHFIPKGTVVTINQYSIHEYPQRWTDADKFNPSRYLDYPLKAGQYVGQADPECRDHWSFGGGRRICPGMHLAENSLFILCAKFLWAFEPRPPLNDAGEEDKIVITEDHYESGTTTLPKPFRCRLIPRNDQIVETVKAEWEQARKEGFDLGDKHVDERGIVVGDAA
ncbi:hypothetical protein LTS15_003858 [Exophiala xenobiotica]|nr:hypothetical protein LTS15_003858 [Exophiala xenobiotica]